MNGSEYSRLRVLYPDMLDFARGKYIPVAAATGKVSHSVGIFVVGYDRELGAGSRYRSA